MKLPVLKPFICTPFGYFSLLKINIATGTIIATIIANHVEKFIIFTPFKKFGFYVLYYI